MLVRVVRRVLDLLGQRNCHGERAWRLVAETPLVDALLLLRRRDGRRPPARLGVVVSVVGIVAVPTAAAALLFVVLVATASASSSADGLVSIDELLHVNIARAVAVELLQQLYDLIVVPLVVLPVAARDGARKQLLEARSMESEAGALERRTLRAVEERLQ